MKKGFTSNVDDTKRFAWRSWLPYTPNIESVYDFDIVYYKPQWNFHYEMGQGI